MTSPARLTTSRWSPEALRGYLVANAIAGRVATPRQDSLAKYRRVTAGDPECTFGLTFARAWTERAVLAEMARRCGVNPVRHRTEYSFNPIKRARELEAGKPQQSAQSR